VPENIRAGVKKITDAEMENAELMTAWRIEGILREFKAFKPKSMFFRYPVHLLDQWDLLTDALAEGELPPRRKKEKGEEKPAKKTEAEATLEALNFLNTGSITIAELAENRGVSEKTIRNHLRNNPKYKIENGIISEVKTEGN
jgi:hypothetical protein